MARIFIEGSPSCLPNTEAYKLAEELGRKLASRGFAIVSSARKGVSEAAFIGAISANEHSTRIAVDCAEINLPRNNKFTKEIIADNYFDMKMRNCINSDAFIFFSGDFAVLSNLSIILQLKQLELMGNKPLICIGEEMLEVLNTLSFYSEETLEIFSSEVFLANTIDEAVAYIVDFFSK